MKKVKEYPQQFSLEIFEKFEKDCYEQIACNKRHSISSKAMIVATIVIYVLASFYPWLNILKKILGTYINITGEHKEDAVEIIAYALTPLIVFFLLLIFTVAVNLILKYTIKAEIAFDELKSDKAKRVRTLMRKYSKSHAIIIDGIMEKYVISEEIFGFDVSLGAIIPLIAVVIKLFISFVIVYIKTESFDIGYHQGYLVSALVFIALTFIPNLITLRIIDFINEKFGCSGMDIMLFYRVRNDWWPEIDEERRAELEYEELQEKIKQLESDKKRVEAKILNEDLNKKIEEYKKSLEEWNKNHLYPTDFT